MRLKTVVAQVVGATSSKWEITGLGLLISKERVDFILICKGPILEQANDHQAPNSHGCISLDIVIPSGRSQDRVFLRMVE